MYFRFRCPQCKTYFYSSTAVMAPKCELDDAPLNAMKPVQHLPPTAQLIDSLAKNKSPRVLSLKRSSSFLSHWSDSDDSDSSAEEEDDLDEDPNYAETRTQFHINMRYTAGERRPFPPDPRGIVGAALNEGKSIAGVRIGDPAGRLSARGVMGMSARACSGRGQPFKRDPKKSEEWCHVLADSLGGQSIPANFVAASYCANTEMCAMEVCLKGQTAFRVSVAVWTSAEHVAEAFYYRIHGPHHTFRRLIDARNNRFTRLDGDALQGALLRWLANPDREVAAENLD